MSGHVSIERMNEALDGLLTSEELGALEDHLEECGPCRNQHARLSEVVSALRALPRAAAPPAEAWQGVAARIGPRGSDGALPEGANGEPEPVAEGAARVLPLPVASRRAEANPEVPRRVTLSVAQLAAAAVLVAVLSATAVWVALGGRVPGERGIASTPPPTLAGAAARAVSMEQSRYGEVVDRLERVLEEGREILAPETLTTIERALTTVDEAIGEVEAALEEDPGSDLLLRLLASHRQTKLGVLRRAAAAVQAQT